MASHDENGYSREGRQRMSLMIGTSLSETMEVASHWSSATHFIIEYKGTHSNYKGNLYVIGSTPIMQSNNFLRIAQWVERKTSWCPDT